MTIKIPTFGNYEEYNEFNNNMRTDPTIPATGEPYYREGGYVPRGTLGDGRVNEGDVETQRTHYRILETLSNAGAIDLKVNFESIKNEIESGTLRTAQQGRGTLQFQRAWNEYAKENGITITEALTEFEKDAAKQILEHHGFENKEKYGPNDYTIKIDENGVGTITHYNKDEIWKEINFRIVDGEAVFDNVTLHKILEDGIVGVETYRAMMALYKEILEKNKEFATEEIGVIETPVASPTVSRETPVEEEKTTTEITVGFTTQGFYNKLSKGELKNKITLMEDVEKEVKEIAGYLSKRNYYEDAGERRSRGSEFTNTYEIVKGLEGRRRERNNQIDEITSERDKLRKQYDKIDIDEYSNFIILEDIDKKVSDFKINFEELDNDFNAMVDNVNRNFPENAREAHIQLIEEMREKVKSNVLEVAQKSTNIDEFINNLNKSEAHGIWMAMSGNYLELQLEISTIDNKEILYDSKIKRMLSKYISEDKLEEAEAYRFSGRRNSLYLDLDKMQRENPSLWQEITTAVVKYEVDSYNEAYDRIYGSITKRVDVREVEQRTPSEETTKITEPTEPKTMPTPRRVEDDRRIIGIPKKSPSKEDLEYLKESFENDPHFADLFINWVNQNFEKTGIERRLESFDDNAINLLQNTMVGVEFWRELQKPEGETIMPLLLEYNKKIDPIDDPNLYYEFEMYVKMRAYEEDGKYNLQLSSIIGKENQEIAWKLYGTDFLQDRKMIQDLVGNVERDKIECGAFQLFVRESGENIMFDNLIGPQTRSFMYTEEGAPSELLMRYFDLVKNNPEERNRLLEESAKNQQQRTQPTNVDLQHKRGG